VRAFVPGSTKRSDLASHARRRNREGDLRPTFRSASGRDGRYSPGLRLLSGAGGPAERGRDVRPPRNARPAVEQVVNLSQWLQEGGEQPHPAPSPPLAGRSNLPTGAGRRRRDLETATVFYETCALGPGRLTGPEWSPALGTRNHLVSLGWAPKNVPAWPRSVLTGPVPPPPQLAEWRVGPIDVLRGHHKRSPEAFATIPGGSGVMSRSPTIMDQRRSGFRVTLVRGTPRGHLTPTCGATSRTLRTRPPDSPSSHPRRVRTRHHPSHRIAAAISCDSTKDLFAAAAAPMTLGSYVCWRVADFAALEPTMALYWGTSIVVSAQVSLQSQRLWVVAFPTRGRPRDG